MTHRASPGIAVPLLAGLLLAAVAADVVRHAVKRSDARERTVAAAGAAIDRSVDAVAAAPASAASLDSANRAAVLRRIAEEGAWTYLPAMLLESDSMLRRWPDAPAGRLLRVAVTRQAVTGFRDAFLANVAWAVARWNAVGLPVGLEQVPDTAGADIVVSWVDRLDSNRTGRTVVTWRRHGEIVHAQVTLATHTPDGRLVVPSQMAALALHELGHALGLGHSPLEDDALYPRTSAEVLTARDRRTAAVLYSLPPGSLK
jgi:hypothetical protein